jgi:hypothetical protein
MKFNCKICNYETDILSNFNRHTKSVSHNKLLNLSTQSTDLSIDYAEQLVMTHKYVCEYCFNIFSCKQTLSRHRLHRCKKTINNKNNTKIDEMANTIAHLNDRIDSMNKLLLEYVKETRGNYSNNKNSNNHIYNISIKNYLQQNYPNAPHLEGIQEPEKIKFDQEYDEFIDALVYNYNEKTLHKYIGDFIIKCYKKDDPADQSLWSSDISRLTYIIKELLANNKSIWNHDYKGIKIKEYIICPILIYIKKYTTEYWMNNLDNLKKLDLEHLNKLNKIYNSIHSIKKEIDNDTLSTDIVKYIAPFFYYGN